MIPKSLAVYVHWPFCVSKCPYCDFFSVPKSSDSICDDVENRLLKDLKTSMQELGQCEISSVFFGGGTPSLMSPKGVWSILNFLRKNHVVRDDIEITLEANPGTFDKQKLMDFRDAGINRLSLGVQSFSDQNLKFLGRIYDAQKAISAAENVANVFDNFSFDFMYGYESQNRVSLEDDLGLATKIGCKHVSCYQLTFEPGTNFYDRLMAGEITPICERKEISMYNFISDFLESREIYRYEVSNYSKPGFESKHNLAYWNYEDYLGIGPGAHSRITINNKKYEIIRPKNICDWGNISRKELTYEEMLQEMILSGLRLTKGIKIKDILRKIPHEVFEKIITKQKLATLHKNKLIYKFNDELKTTKSGFLKLNSVIEFLLA